MKTITAALSIIALSGSLQASNAIDSDIESHIEADIALIHSIEQRSRRLPGDFLIVGGDPDPNWCDFGNIQAALNSAAQSGITEIRIANNKTYNENLIINDQSVSLISGYSSCQTAGVAFSKPNTTQAVIDGRDIASVVKITGASQKNTIVLRNLRLINGRGSIVKSDSTGGGILSNNADAIVSLINVDVRSNDALYGGGISLIGGDTDMALQDSRVQGNVANYGAGIYCSGGGSSVVLSENSGIVANVANGTGDPPDGRGAGAYLDSCYFAIYSGSASGGPVGISSNWAFDDGGGIHAENSTILINGHENCNESRCIGDDVNPVNISGNIAGFSQDFGLGGGIYALASSVTVYAGLFEGNSSKSSGGGISILGGISSPGAPWGRR